MSRNIDRISSLLSKHGQTLKSAYYEKRDTDYCESTSGGRWFVEVDEDVFTGFNIDDVLKNISEYYESEYVQ
jgi:hypothetical protein